MTQKGLPACVLLILLVLLACATSEANAAGCGNCAFTVSTSGSITGTVLGPLSLASSSNLVFGSLVRPALSAGNGTVAVSTAGVRTVGGTGLAVGSATASAASFTITGEGATAITVSVVPANLSLSLTSGSNSLPVTLTADKSGAQTLGGASGSDGTLTVKVGGSFSLANTTPRGAYAGSFTVTASYQ